MSDAQGYVLGQSERAARRLEIQDAHFAEVSEQLLDELALRPGERVLKLAGSAIPTEAFTEALRRVQAESGYWPASSPATPRGGP
jgi:hypothetical protein